MIDFKTKMPYTSAFIQELFRFRTLAPLGIPRKANFDTEINGYVIPKGIQVKFKIKNNLFKFLMVG